MLAWLTLLIGAAPPSLSFEPRTPIALVVQLPAGESIHTSSRQIADWIEDQLTGSTFELDVREDELTRGCGGEPFCIVDRARAAGVLGCLIVVSIVAVDDHTDEISAIALDSAAPERSLMQRSAPKTLRSPEDARRWPASFVKEELLPELRRRLPRAERGSLEIATSEPKAIIELDGRTIGVATSTRTLVTLIPVGEHQLRVVHADGTPLERSIAVRTGEITSVELLRATSSSWSTGLLIAGVAVGALGAALTVWAAVFSVIHRDRGGACVPITGECDPPNRFWSLEQLFAGRPGIDHGNVLALPLGYSLLATGTVWSLGAWLFDDELPWWQFLAGLALGGTLYGISALAAH